MSPLHPIALSHFVICCTLFVRNFTRTICSTICLLVRKMLRRHDRLIFPRSFPEMCERGKLRLDGKLGISNQSTLVPRKPMRRTKLQKNTPRIFAAVMLIGNKDETSDRRSARIAQPHKSVSDATIPGCKHGCNVQWCSCEHGVPIKECVMSIVTYRWMVISSRCRTIRSQPQNNSAFHVDAAR